MPCCHWIQVYCFLKHWYLQAKAYHHDAIKWKHFPRCWPVVREIHQSPANSVAKGQWRGTLIFSLICAWTNGWANNGYVGDLRRQRAHYDVTVRDDRGSPWMWPRGTCIKEWIKIIKFKGQLISDAVWAKFEHTEKTHRASWSTETIDDLHQAPGVCLEFSNCSLGVCCTSCPFQKRGRVLPW